MQFIHVSNVNSLITCSRVNDVGTHWTLCIKIRLQYTILSNNGACLWVDGWVSEVYCGRVEVGVVHVPFCELSFNYLQVSLLWALQHSRSAWGWLLRKIQGQFPCRKVLVHCLLSCTACVWWKCGWKCGWMGGCVLQGWELVVCMCSLSAVLQNLMPVHCCRQVSWGHFSAPEAPQGDCWERFKSSFHAERYYVCFMHCLLCPARVCVGGLGVCTYGFVGCHSNTCWLL